VPKTSGSGTTVLQCEKHDVPRQNVFQNVYQYQHSTMSPLQTFGTKSSKDTLVTLGKNSHQIKWIQESKVLSVSFWSNATHRRTINETAW
jgi:hypothetical protein